MHLLAGRKYHSFGSVDNGLSNYPGKDFYNHCIDPIIHPWLPKFYLQTITVMSFIYTEAGPVQTDF